MAKIDPDKLNATVNLMQKLLISSKYPTITQQGKTACIEADENDFISILMQRDIIVPAILAAGFERVILNLEGKTTI